MRSDEQLARPPRVQALVAPAAGRAAPQSRAAAAGAGPGVRQLRKTRCKHCGRRFNPVWKSYLCHLCGRWVCEPCSSVVEREKELLRVRFVRCCVTCTKMLNKLPEPDVLLPYLAVPYVTASSHSQIGLHLADALRTNKDLRPSVLQLLNCLGRPLGTNTQILADIREEDWAQPTRWSPPTGAKPGNPEWVQFVVQQCFEVSLPELSLEECVVSEADGTRRYPIFYDEETDVPFAPTCSNEAARDECMTRCNLLGRGIAEQKEVQLICHLAAKEFDAPCATVTALHADKQYALAPVNRSSICVSTERAKSFCAHAMVSDCHFLCGTRCSMCGFGLSPASEVTLKAPRTVCYSTSGSPSLQRTRAPSLRCCASWTRSPGRASRRCSTR
ncbi:Glycoprotein-N-acetylgalactosamine 3-beta-galactosyltransferase 1 [Phytophthora cinnamomi]|uniref:Glycoprotein-N-acetylgalactosamine 3-beta-galactosyltransferase 1 n=1 Tax=Phytophthora cinnamomi TaxID=4785 RepID=UPI00355973BB|nr:Glycoprotein-N-acetylgalactosamine 3-beta-galactosyltransferase 1 [Phytophthora cinnamomi]